MSIIRTEILILSITSLQTDTHGRLTHNLNYFVAPSFTCFKTWIQISLSHFTVVRSINNTLVSFLRQRRHLLISMTTVSLRMRPSRFAACFGCML